MIVDNNSIFKNNLVNIRQFTINENVQYFIHGMFIYEKYSEGITSVEAFHRYYSYNKKFDFDSLRGAFSCIIRFPDGAIVAFTDNSNLHCLYISEKEISTGFLELLRYRKNLGEKLTFDQKSICQLLTLNRILFWDTPVVEVKRSRAENFYTFQKERIKINSKEIKEIEAPSQIGSEGEFLHEIANSLKTEKYIQALTGGYDSRMVYACMREIKQVPIFTSDFAGDAEEDVRVAQKVTMAVGDKLDIVTITNAHLTQDKVEELFSFSDGMMPFLSAGAFRVSEFQKRFSEAGYKFLITGDGGVLHKDWEWMQDLPFYNRRDTNLSRFYEQRIELIKQYQNLSNTMQHIYEKQKSSVLEFMKQFVKETNTKSYDYLYFYVNGKPDSAYTKNGVSIQGYAPLWERDMVRFSYNQTRKMRFFYNLIRKETTSANKNIARIPTVYGTTSSFEIRFLLRDVIFQVMDYIKKFYRLIGRRFFNITDITGKSKGSKIFEAEIRNLANMNEAIQCAICNDFIKKEADINTLSDRELSVIYLLYRLDRIINV